MNTIRTCPGCKQVLEPSSVDGLCPKCLMQAALDTGVDVGPDTQDGGTHRSFAAPTPEELAQFFPQLEILELLGRGGMGAVYKARQKQLERFVAVKILPPGIGDDPAFAERFTREAKALAKLNHPNIVTLYEFGQTDGLFYFIMEFVDGLNLRQLLEAGRIAPREALAIVPQICDALQYAHDSSIVHRDIKPENILLDRRGRVKVADFGLAKIVLQRGTGSLPVSSDPTGKLPVPPLVTAAGKVMGTPQYMAPEQTEHPSEVDHRADIYSLGVVFYQMLTGELPSGQAFAPPSSRMRGIMVDVRLDEVVLRALEKEPNRRYQQASILKTRVEMISTTPPPQNAAAAAMAPPTPGKPWQSPTSGWGWLVGKVFGCTFTSPLAYKCANLSALAFLSFIRFVPLPGFRHFFSFSGFSGLIGLAFLIELLARRKSGHPDPSFRYIFLVGRRAGKAVIHWKGVLLSFAIVFGVVLVGALVAASWLMPGRPAGSAFFVALFGAVIVIGTGIRSALNTPVDQLMPLDEPQPIASSTSSTPSRFSRTAIMGAAWQTVAIFGALTMGGGSLPPYWPLWQKLLAWLIMFATVTAPFGTTILGCIAIAQIRRSAGRLYGLWLALLGALLFPLLALDAAIWLILGNAWRFWVSFADVSRPLDAFLLNHDFGQRGMFVLTPVICVAVDFLIIRRAWRAVSKPVGGQAELNSIVAKPGDRRWLTTAPAIIGAVLLGAAIMGGVAFGVARMMRQRQVQLLTHLSESVDQVNRLKQQVANTGAQTFGPVIERVVTKELHLVFRRGNATTAAGALPATTAASGSGPEVVRVPEPGGFLSAGTLLLILALVAGLIILVVIVIVVMIVSLARRAAANQPAAGLTAGGTGAPPNTVSLAPPDRKTGFQPVTADSASRLSANETTGWKPVGHDRQDACPPHAKLTALGATTANSLSNGPDAKASQHGRLALGLCLVGLVLPVAATAYCMLTGSLLDRWVWIGVFALTGLFELPALIMGIIGWKSRAGKAAVIVAVALPLLLVAGGVILYPALHDSSARARVAATRQRVTSDHKVKQDTNMATLPKFGTVVELVVNDLDEGQGNEALHLRTGTLSSVPADAQKDRKMLDAWFKTNRMDLLADYARNRWALFSIGLTLADFPAARWDEATPADLTPALASGTTLERLERSGQVFYLLPEQAQWPVTFAFKTQEGDQGLLQLTGATDNPNGLRIRYKMVARQPSGQRLERE